MRLEDFTQIFSPKRQYDVRTAKAVDSLTDVMTSITLVTPVRRMGIDYF